MNHEQMFTKSFNGIGYEFFKVFYPGEMKYRIHFTDPATGKAYDFHLRSDENNLWKIEAQVLPTFVHELESVFSDAINLHDHGSVL